MGSLALRKSIGLEQKLTALSDEFKEWLDASEANKPFEKHNTQIRAITGHLAGLRRQTETMFANARKEGTILDQARNLESMVLGIRRIWEFFRAKLVQRRDAGLRAFLQFADELAWACYKPVLDVNAGARREPPLVFLNGGLSPFALPRNEAFPAEAVPGQPLAGSTYDGILGSMPIPVIGVPWYQVAHIPDLPVVAHETGHAIEHDFGWQKTVTGRIENALKGSAGAVRSVQWQAWASEMFADAWGCRSLGPVYLSSLRDFLAESTDQIEGEVATETGKYPTATLRILLCAKLLETNFSVEAAACRDEWLTQYPDHQMKKHEGDVDAIASALSLTGTWSAALDFTDTDWTAAGDACDEIKAGKDADSATSPARLIVAARRLYDEDPKAFTDKKWVDAILKQSRALVYPGTRAGEQMLSDDEKKTLTEQSMTAGAAMFNDFKKWVGVTAP